MSGARILVCDDEAGLREMLGILLKRHGYDVTIVEDVRSATQRIAEDRPYAAVVTDLLMPDGSGMSVLEAARQKDAGTQVLMITAFATTEQAVLAMRQGAYDYIQKPFKNSELLATLEKALEKRAIVEENRTLKARVRGGITARELTGTSDAMARVRDLVERVAPSLASVLVTGESGTGKEMVARALHFSSPRADGPFVAVHCGALPENLMESELFGHEKGAFTGATARKDGLFQAAHGGTLFLDEVGELPPQLQVKLLRVLQDRTIRRVGGHEELSVDARVVAATNRDVEEEIQAGRFREDLFYRLNVIRIHMPPLRERRQDIVPLAEEFMEKHGRAQGRRGTLTAAAAQHLARLPYPGNVRQLENLIERALALGTGDTVDVADLGDGGAVPTDEMALPSPSAGFDLDAYLADVEKRLLLRALEEAQGVRTNAAKLVGMSFRQFRYRLAKHGADEPD